VLAPEDLPPGKYATWLGLYDAASAGAVRLPLLEADGFTTAHEMIELGSITVISKAAIRPEPEE
jgi:hypothetical protein